MSLPQRCRSLKNHNLRRAALPLARGYAGIDAEDLLQITGATMRVACITTVTAILLGYFTS